MPMSVALPPMCVLVGLLKSKPRFEMSSSPKIENALNLENKYVQDKSNL